MDTHVTLSSKAESMAKGSLKFSFCRSLNLENIKDTLAKMLNHIGDDGMFAEYTMHDITHVDGMLNLLDKIIPEKTIDHMTPADWLMIVMAIYFHDLGMHIPSGEYDRRRDNNEYIVLKEEVLKCDDVKQYVESLDGDKGEKFLYQEYVRRYHGERIYDWIMNCDRKEGEPYKIIAELLMGLDNSFRADLALICKSHQMDELPERLQSVDEAYGSTREEKVNLLYVSILLRSSDILHMTHDRAPDIEYRIISPQNKISVIEWAKQKAVRSIDIHYDRDESGAIDKNRQPHAFEIQAKFTDDQGYFSFKTFIEYAIEELKRCHNWCEASRRVNANDYYFPWTDIDTSRVQAEGFLNQKLRFEIDQRNILKLLTGHTLYNDSTVVLRELIQNAMDAGRLQDSKSKVGSKYTCKIVINWDSKKRILKISDNATGMDLDSIKNYLLKVGASKYQSESFKKEYPDFHSISRFGIGLLTCFMISDDVNIYTIDEQEKQCHLLKIRNLNGEYLMRNDADSSNIIGRTHGTTFELKVRPNINFDDIENQVRQWIIKPFGKVSLIINGSDPVDIGFSSIQSSIEDYAKRLSEVDMEGGKHRVYTKSQDGIEVAFLQQYNSITKIWSLYHYIEPDYIKDAPIGICVEGIKVTDNTPGIRGRSFIALANCSGKGAPSTNVARNDLEGGIALDRMYEAVFRTYIDSFIDQIDQLSIKYSLIWATTEVNYLIETFYNSRLYGRFDKREILWKVLRNAKCIPTDNGTTIRLESINSLPEKVITIDSRAFYSAVSLLRNTNITEKTAYGLLSELENHKVKDEIVLPVDSIASCIYELFVEDYGVESINVDEENRKIKFVWSKNAGKWRYEKASRTRTGFYLFILMNEEGVNIEGIGDNTSIVSDNCIYLVKDSPLLTFLRRVINDLKGDDAIMDVLCDLICRVFIEDETIEERTVDDYINSEENYLKRLLFEKVSIEELKKAIKGCHEHVVNIDKYYRSSY